MMLFMHNTAIRRTLCAMSVVALMVMFAGCGDLTSKPKTLSLEDFNALAARKNLESESHNPTDKFSISDEKISLDNSGERIIGDRRPLYVVEGRLTSNLLYTDANEVVVKVYFVDKNLQALDTAEFTVDNIAPQGTKAFRTVVPLLPPKNKRFNYVFEIYAVKTSPSLHPWPNLH
jgi:hypothetical protein